MELSLVGSMLLGYELDMEPLYVNLKCKLLYEKEGWHQVRMVSEIVLVKE